MSLLFSGRGGGNGLHASGTWPFVKLEIYDDKIVHKALSTRAEIPFAAVRYIKRKRVIPVIGDGLILYLNKPELPEYVSFFGFKDIDKAENILREKCKSLVSEIGWLEDPYNSVGSFVLVIMILIFVMAIWAGMY